MPKLIPIFKHGDTSPDRKPIQYQHWCPACDAPHVFSVVGPDKHRWTFDGNMESPTFEPSMRLLGGWDAKRQHFTRTECHYFLRKGVIEYCNDHPKREWRRKSVKLPDFPEKENT